MFSYKCATDFYDMYVLCVYSTCFRNIHKYMDEMALLSSQINVYTNEYEHVSNLHANILIRSLDKPIKHIKACLYWAISEMPFEWCFAGWPIVARDCVLNVSRLYDCKSL